MSLDLINFALNHIAFSSFKDWAEDDPEEYAREMKVLWKDLALPHVEFSRYPLVYSALESYYKYIPMGPALVRVVKPSRVELAVYAKPGASLFDVLTTIQQLPQWQRFQCIEESDSEDVGFNQKVKVYTLS